MLARFVIVEGRWTIPGPPPKKKKDFSSTGDGAELFSCFLGARAKYQNVMHSRPPTPTPTPESLDKCLSNGILGVQKEVSDITGDSSLSFYVHICTKVIWQSVLCCVMPLYIHTCIFLTTVTMDPSCAQVEGYFICSIGSCDQVGESYC